MNSCLAAIILIAILICKEGGCIDVTSNDIILSSGPKIRFSNTKAKSVLTTWAKELNTNGGSVTHFQAVNRERQVVDKINSGLWDVAVYHEYQRMSAVTGNVDSARLLVDYGIGQTIHEILQSETFIGQLFKAISLCDIKSLKQLIDTHEDEYYPGIAADDGTNLLMVASYFNCLNIVPYLLASDVEQDVNAVGTHGLNALLVAASRGHANLVTLLVSTGSADVNFAHKFGGNNALHMAAELNNAGVIRELCNLGINSSVVTTSGSTALHVAASSNASYDTLHSLIKVCGIDGDSLLNSDTTALYLAAQFGHVHTVTALIELGVQVSFSMPFSQYKGEKFLTPLSGSGDVNLDALHSSVINTEPGNGAEAIHAAAENGHAEVVRVLVTLGKADINTVSISVTPLHLAAQYNRLEVGKVLVELGADVDAPSYTDQSTPLYHAVGHNHLQMVEFLLQSGANVHAKQNSGAFPLLYAAHKDMKGVTLKKLLEYGADVDDFASDSHMTAFLAAVQSNNTMAVGVLLQHSTQLEAKGEKGIDFTHSTLQGLNVFHYAALSNNEHIMQTFFYEFNSRRDHNNEYITAKLTNAHTLVDGCTPLHYAALHNHVHMLHMLAVLHGDVHLKMKEISSSTDNRNYRPTALYLAVNSNHLDTVYVLLHYLWESAVVNEHLDSPSFNTPLLLAIEKKSTDMVTLLLTGTHEGLNKEDNHLSVYVRYKHIRFLADPNIGIAGGGRKQSPLLYAVSLGLAAIVKQLLISGAYCNVLIATSRESVQNVDLQDTLVDIARKRRDFDTMQVLMQFPQCDPDTIRRNQLHSQETGAEL